MNAGICTEQYVVESYINIEILSMFLIFKQGFLHVTAFCFKYFIRYGLYVLSPPITLLCYDNTHINFLSCSFSLLIRPSAAIIISSNVAYSYSCAEPDVDPISTPAEIAARLHRELEWERVCTVASSEQRTFASSESLYELILKIFYSKYFLLSNTSRILVY